MRVDHAAIAPRAPFVPPASRTAAAACRRNGGAPRGSALANSSAMRRRFHNDMPTQTAMPRLASITRRQSARRAMAASAVIGVPENGSS